MFVPLQAASDPVAVAGTVGLFAVFLSVTAHVAARNVLGDVRVRRALVVGPLPAAIAVAGTAFEVPPLVNIAAALAVDFGAVRYAYGRDWRLSAYVTFIHVVVSVILGTILFALLFVISSMPG
ncbi:MAG: hypothetical protein ABEJ22_08045 [Haloferacaceae archaeon]